jgi:hypothetical protein
MGLDFVTRPPDQFRLLRVRQSGQLLDYGVAMKRFLAPALFFITIAVMAAFLGYKHLHPQATKVVISQNGQIRAEDSVDKFLLEQEGELSRQLDMTISEANEIKSKPHLTPSDKQTLANLSSKISDLQGNIQKLQKTISEARISSSLAVEPMNAKVVQPEEKPESSAKELQAFMPMVITGFLGLVAVGLLIWRKEDSDAQKWVYSTFGAILGYWLKGGS